MTSEQTKKLLKFVDDHTIRRHANHIFVTNRKTSKLVRFFHSATTEESEAQLQTFLNEITL